VFEQYVVIVSEGSGCPAAVSRAGSGPELVDARRHADMVPFDKLRDRDGGVNHAGTEARSLSLSKRGDEPRWCPSTSSGTEMATTTTQARKHGR
jgi:hypothetical protein